MHSLAGTGPLRQARKLAFYDLKSLCSVNALYLFFLHSRVNKIETSIGMTAYPAFFSPRANSTYPAPQAVIKENSKLNANKMADLLISNHHLLTCVLWLEYRLYQEGESYRLPPCRFTPDNGLLFSDRQWFLIFRHRHALLIRFQISPYFFTSIKYSGQFS